MDRDTEYLLEEIKRYLETHYITQLMEIVYYAIKENEGYD